MGGVGTHRVTGPLGSTIDLSLRSVAGFFHFFHRGLDLWPLYSILPYVDSLVYVYSNVSFSTRPIQGTYNLPFLA